MNVNQIYKEDIEASFKNPETPLFSGVGDYVVKGRLPVNMSVLNTKVIFWAANPPNFNNSFSGSGLPFPNYQVAYENTPNVGAVKTFGGRFKFNLIFPNSYYEGLGTNYVKPHVNVMVVNPLGENEVFQMELGHGIPYRTLTYPKKSQDTRERHDCLFYAGREELPVVSQEQLLRNSGYHGDKPMAKNFWGGSVPQG